MKICQSHWNNLREAIELRGLFPFVCKNGEQLINQLKEDLTIPRQLSTDKPRPYDPLASANMMIWSRALECGGLYLMTGDYCPLCELEKNTPAKAEDWINPCCDSILEDFRKKNWIGDIN